MKKATIIIIIIVIIILALLFLTGSNEQENNETYNGQEDKENGQENGEDEQDQEETMIRITNPEPNQTIESPVTIEGEARGTWFFEASFPVKILDANGNAVATTSIQTTEDWMTENFVSFQAEIEFQKPETQEGTIVLEKANPSGLPENEDQITIPIKFE